MSNNTLCWQHATTQMQMQVDMESTCTEPALAAAAIYLLSKETASGGAVRTGGFF
jgi:hypothetical protein